MWTWFNCYLSGRHDFGVWCEPGTIFLRCIHCGKRSGGWAIPPLRKPAAADVTALGPRALDANRKAGPAVASRVATPATAPGKPGPRILRFDRIALR